MTVNDSWNVVYEVRAGGEKRGFETKEDAIEYAKSIVDEKPVVFAIEIRVDGEGYEEEIGEEAEIWTPERGEIEIEAEDPCAKWKKAAAERRPVERDAAEIMGISEWEEPECEECCDPFDCFAEDDGRFADREGRAEGSILTTLDPEELLKSLADELGVEIEVKEPEEEPEWPEPEPEESRWAEDRVEFESPEEEPEKTEIVVKAEVPSDVADEIKDGEVEVKVEKEGEIPEVSAEAEEKEEESEDKDGEELEEAAPSGSGDVESALKAFAAELGESCEKPEKLAESDVESALKDFDADLGESVEEDDMTDLELAERLEFARRRRLKAENE